MNRVGGRTMNNSTPFPANLQIVFKPETKARDAMLAIFRELLEIMRKNEDGIKTGDDPEYLHNPDF